MFSTLCLNMTAIATVDMITRKIAVLFKYYFFLQFLVTHRLTHICFHKSFVHNNRARQGNSGMDSEACQSPAHLCSSNRLYFGANSIRA